MATNLGDALEKMLKEYNLKQKVDQTDVLNNWEKIVGKSIARHTDPLKIYGNKLYIEAESPAWRNQLLFQKDYIKDQINKNIKNNKIKEIILK